MLAMLEGFLIRYTIPTLLNEKDLKENLPAEDLLKLKKVIKHNNDLIDGINELDVKFKNIRNYFLARAMAINPDDPIKLLPSFLSKITVPTLRSLSLHFIRNNKNSFDLTILTPELMQDVEVPDIVEIEPFGTLSFEEAHHIMLLLLELLELEINKTELDSKQILNALRIAIILSCPTHKYMSMLQNQEIKDCNYELQKVLYWAIRRKHNDVFFKLLEIKSDFDIKNHLEYLLPTAIDYINMKIFEYLFPLASISNLRENTFLLHSAAKAGNSALVNRFLKLQFDPKKRDKKDLLPLHSAVVGENFEIYDSLLTYVQTDLTEVDHFHLFRNAAINDNIDFIRYLVGAGLNINSKNSNNQVLIESLQEKLAENMKEEVKLWGKAYSSFPKLNRMIALLLNKAEPSSKIILNSALLEHFDKPANTNPRFRKNITMFMDHRAVAGNYNIYQRYISPSDFKNSIVLTILTLITLGIPALFIVGITEKFNVRHNRVLTDKEADGFLIASGALTLLELVILAAICIPRKKLSVTNFFRTNQHQPATNNMNNPLLPNNDAPAP